MCSYMVFLRRPWFCQSLLCIFHECTAPAGRTKWPLTYYWGGCLGKSTLFLHNEPVMSTSKSISLFSIVWTWHHIIPVLYVLCSNCCAVDRVIDLEAASLVRTNGVIPGKSLYLSASFVCFSKLQTLQGRVCHSLWHCSLPSAKGLPTSSNI